MKIMFHTKKILFYFVSFFLLLAAYKTRPQQPPPTPPPTQPMSHSIPGTPLHNGTSHNHHLDEPTPPPRKVNMQSISYKDSTINSIYLVIIYFILLSIVFCRDANDNLFYFTTAIILLLFLIINFFIT